MPARLARISILSTCLSLLGACELTGGGDDESGMDEVCASGCEKPVQCLVTTVDDPGPEDWEMKDAFCADGIFELVDYFNVDKEIIRKCRNLTGLHDEQVYTFKTVDLLCQQSQSNACPDWSPADQVTQAEDGYTIRVELVDALLADASPLVACDTTRFASRISGPGFTVTNVSTGDLAYEMGLRTDDAIISVDRRPVEDLTDVLTALIELREFGEPSHDLTIERAGQLLDLHYEIIP